MIMGIEIGAMAYSKCIQCVGGENICISPLRVC